MSDLNSWNQQNASKPAGSSMPEWQMMGFGSQAEFDNSHNSTPTEPLPAGVEQPTPQPINSPAQLPAPAIYDTSDGLGAYFQANPGRRSAYGTLKAVTDRYGLSGDDIQAILKDGMVQGRSPDEISLAMREAPSWKNGIGKPILERQRLGLAPISEQNVLDSRRAYQQVDRMMGSPEGFNGTEDYDNLLVKDVSPTEYKDRWMNGYQAASQADPRTKGELQRLFGLTDGHMAAFFLDPDKTEALLQKQLTEAKIGASSLASGFGQVGADQLSNLAGQGVTEAQARQGFGQLASQQGLMTANPGEGAAVSRDTAMSAVFDNNAAAQEALTRQRASRQAAFIGTGSFADANRQGLTGSGNAT